MYVGVSDVPAKSVLPGGSIDSIKGLSYFKRTIAITGPGKIDIIEYRPFLGKLEAQFQDRPKFPLYQLFCLNIARIGYEGD